MEAVGIDRGAHRAFLNRYYGWSRGIYDLTRRYYLFGRDELLERLGRENWSTLVEIGPGTGRNLRVLRSLRPGARLGGVDASDSMLELAARRCPTARLVHGFAEEADLVSVLGERPERILFSYCLSMVQDPIAALENALRQLEPGGTIEIVDFADGRGLPAPLRTALHRWLREFHVAPLPTSLFAGRRAHLRFGPGRYWLAASVEADRARAPEPGPERA